MYKLKYSYNPPPLRSTKNLLIVTWILVQAFLYYRFGIVTVDEAKKYLDEAEYFIREGAFSIPKNLFYSIYILLIAIMKLMGAGVIGVYLMQVFINGLSTILFYKLCSFLAGNSDKTTAPIATLLLIICIPYQSWSTHLYTESIFTSLLIFFLYQYAVSGMSSIKTCMLLGLIVFARPTGILLVPALLIYGIMSNWYEKKIKPSTIGITLAGSVIFYFILSYEMQGKGEFDFIRPYTEGHVICYVPAAEVPENLKIPKNPNSIEGLLFFIYHNPLYFGKLALKKLWYFFSMQRPYYSNLHNIAIGVFFYPLYILAIFGFRFFMKKDRMHAIWLASYCSVFVITVMLTCDDWLNRFILPILPVVIFFSAYVISKWLNKGKIRITY